MAGGLSQQAVGLFGGTFDPVHQGHLDLAHHVLERCRLDRILFIPAPYPPHKRQPVASFAHRVAMIEAALAGEGARMRCSCIEAGLPVPSYTVHTVEALRGIDDDCEYFLIIGADSLRDLPQWYQAARLLAAVSLIVVRRDALGSAEVDAVLGKLDPTYRFDAQHARWWNRQGRSVFYLDDIELPISSSSIRESLARGEVPSMLPRAVLAYIRQHHLYGWRNRI